MRLAKGVFSAKGAAFTSKSATGRIREIKKIYQR
jgi:hypothetical protein